MVRPSAVSSLTECLPAATSPFQPVEPFCAPSSVTWLYGRLFTWRVPGAKSAIGAGSGAAAVGFLASEGRDAVAALVGRAVEFGAGSCDEGGVRAVRETDVDVGTLIGEVEPALIEASPAPAGVRSAVPERVEGASVVAASPGSRVDTAVPLASLAIGPLALGTLALGPLALGTLALGSALAAGVGFGGGGVFSADWAVPARPSEDEPGGFCPANQIPAMASATTPASPATHRIHDLGV